MATIFIPPQWRDLTAGMPQVQVAGDTLRQVIAALDTRYPGIAARIVEEGHIASGLAVSIDGAITSRGLLAPVAAQSEVHFLPAIGGG